MADQSGASTSNGPLDRQTTYARLEELEDIIFSRSQLQDQGNQASLARAFLEALPIVKKEELPENSQICHICKELFDAPNVVPEMTDIAEVPVKLPCNHIMGEDCLKKWLENNNSCPLCRNNLFGQSNEERQALHAAISEYTALLGHQTYRQQSETLSTLILEANSDNLELSVLRMEIGELAERMGELHAAPDTEENRAAVTRIARRHADIDMQLERVEERIRERHL